MNVTQICSPNSGSLRDTCDWVRNSPASGLPTPVVLKGGYGVNEIGVNVAAELHGFREAVG